MGLSWLESLIYGLISGFAEFLPISSEGHRAIYLQLIGASDEAGLQLFSHLGALLALLILCTPMIAKLNRERKIAAITKKRRKRQPDIRSLMDIRLLKAASLPLLIFFVLYPVVRNLHQRLWVLAILLFINGCILYFPQFYPRANKDGRSLSSLDAMVLGLGGAAGIFPGVSRVGSAVSFGMARGADRRYILDIVYLLCIPALLVVLLFDFIALVSFTGSVSALSWLRYFTAGFASFASAYCGILTMRFFTVRAGFSGFGFYCWGLALFSFILYLTIS